MTFKLMSSWGELVCEAATGKVRREESTYSADPENEQGAYPLSSIVSVDVEEWRKTYPGESLDGGCHDILDFGLTYENGETSPPAMEWREDFRKHRNEAELHAPGQPTDFNES